MPRVLFITADQWRGDCLGHRGHPCLRTPALDALARDGLSFTRHFAQCSPCGPSRASLHTGTYLMTHRSVRNGTPLDPRLSNLALEVARLGLSPGLIGYTDTSVDPRGLAADDPRLRTYTGVLPGYRQLLPDSEGPVAWTRHLRDLGYDLQPTTHPEDEPDIWWPARHAPETPGRGPTFAPTRYPPEHSDTAFSVDHAIEHVRAHAGGDWFLHLSLLRPHPPFFAPAPFNALYGPHDGPALLRHADAAREAAVHPYAAHLIERSHEWCEEQRMPMADDSARLQMRATYWGMMSEVDHHLGRLFEALRETGDYADTLIVFTSDHGEQLWDHWVVGKRSYHDQSFHIPLIVRAPDTPAALRGGHIDAFTENVDIMPTILEWLGATPPAQCDGLSLTPWLRGTAPPTWRDAVFYELDFRDLEDDSVERTLGLDLESCSLAVLRDARFKYVHFTELPPLLFDLRADPGELIDRAGDDAHAPVLGAYARRLLSHRMRHADRSLTGLFLSREQGLMQAATGRRPVYGPAGVGRTQPTA